MITDRLQLEDALRKIDYPGWWFSVRELEEGYLVQTHWFRPDTDTGMIGTGASREEFLSLNCTEDQIVKTCWVLVMLTIQHEAMEFFKYKGKRVFDPHMPVNKLIEMTRE